VTGRAAAAGEEGPRTYRLLGRLLLEEVRAEDLPQLRSVPELADALPPVRSPAGEVEAWLQSIRVEHHRLFGMNVHPYESVFLSDQGTLNTGRTARVEALYSDWGFQPPRELRYGAPDHLGLQMLAAAHLSEAHLREAEADWLRDHPGLWGPVLCLTVGRIAREPFYRATAALTEQVLLKGVERVQARQSGSRISEAHSQPGSTRFGNESDGVAEGDGIGLEELIGRLAIPSRLGVLLTRDEIGGLARRLELPAGILDRPLMLKNLFRAAGQFQRVGELLEGLMELIRHADERYREWARAYPAWTLQARYWTDRTGTALELLTRMRSELESAPHGPSPP